MEWNEDGDNNNYPKKRKRKKIEIAAAGNLNVQAPLFTVQRPPG